MKTTEDCFASPYRMLFSGYVKYKRAIGQKICQGVICRLNALSQYLAARNGCNAIMTKEAVEGFLHLHQGKKAETIKGMESLLRQLAIYLRNSGCNDIYLLPEGITRSESNFVPYVFSENEISRFFKAVDTFKWYRESESKTLFYSTLFRLLYSTGLRIEEALSLGIEDVNLENRIITVIKSKENASRLVPFDDSMHGWLTAYKEERIKTDGTYFFRSPRSERYAAVTVQGAFRIHLLPASGITPKKGQRISIHSLRHTFACHSLDKMIKAGEDAFCSLPYLSTYMGHANVNGTERYLRLASERFNSILDSCHSTYEGIINEI
ncbi:MAG: hypothetical protein EOM64_09785 [Erysipelotrichia bacterium]|nr:hypothetical protein [Erysipelotrichia bacterium]